MAGTPLGSKVGVGRVAGTPLGSKAGVGRVADPLVSKVAVERVVGKTLGSEGMVGRVAGTALGSKAGVERVVGTPLGSNFLCLREVNEENWPKIRLVAPLPVEVTAGILLHSADILSVFRIQMINFRKYQVYGTR